jgi:hypothetical protein
MLLLSPETVGGVMTALVSAASLPSPTSRMWVLVVPIVLMCQDRLLIDQLPMYNNVLNIIRGLFGIHALIHIDNVRERTHYSSVNNKQENKPRDYIT